MPRSSPRRQLGVYKKKSVGVCTVTRPTAPGLRITHLSERVTQKPTQNMNTNKEMMFTHHFPRRYIISAGICCYFILD